MRIKTFILLSTVIIFMLNGCSQKEKVLFDFETGTLKGWTLEGQNPFINQSPISADSVNTWEKSCTGFQGSYMLAAGSNKGEPWNNPDGQLVSKSFKIDRNFLTFYLAGELNPNVRVYLQIDTNIVRESFGNNFNNLQLRGWDVTRYKGSNARIVIEDKSPLPSLLRVDHFFLTNTPPPDPKDWIKNPQPGCSNMAMPGEFSLLYKNNVINPGWQTFSSSLVLGHDQKWHLYAAAAEINAKGKNENIKYVMHFYADNLNSRDWDFGGVVMMPDEQKGEKFINDPFVIFENGVYYMYYTGSGKTWSGWHDCSVEKQKPWPNGKCGEQGPYSIYLAISKDGEKWDHRGSIITDAPFAFSPFICKTGDEWTMYYASAEPGNINGKHAIVSAVSKDLLHWQGRNIALLDAPDGASPWPEFSYINHPIVIQRDAFWYLFTGPVNNNSLPKNGLHLFKSDSPSGWDNLPGHNLILAENSSIVNSHGNWYITHSNDFSGGVWIAPLYWNE